MSILPFQLSLFSVIFRFRIHDLAPVEIPSVQDVYKRQALDAACCQQESGTEKISAEKVTEKPAGDSAGDAQGDASGQETEKNNEINEQNNGKETPEN